MKWRHICVLTTIVRKRDLSPTFYSAQWKGIIKYAGEEALDRLKKGRRRKTALILFKDLKLKKNILPEGWNQTSKISLILSKIFLHGSLIELELFKMLNGRPR